MNGSENILAWLHTHVKMHEKRRRTLGHLVFAPMLLRGMAVLALRRAMKTGTEENLETRLPKPPIPAVWKGKDISCP